MKTEYEFIHFKKVEDKPKTSVWACMNTENRSVLGHVKWYGPWRQYCFFPEAFVVFHNGCLQDICHFIQQLKEERVRACEPKRPAEDVQATSAQHQL